VFVCITAVSTIAVSGAGPSWSVSSENTTTTILSVFAELDVSPDFGPPGTVITVKRGPIGIACSANVSATFVEVSFSAATDLQAPLAEAKGNFPLTLIVPVGTAPGPYLVRGRCANDVTTVFPYHSVAFAVSVGSASSTSAATTTSSSSTTVPISDPTTVTDEARPPPTTTSTSTVAPTATLPRTGSNDSVALAAFGVSLLASGGLLVLSRRRLRRS
jgi:LPXTG-motif cell wall-anchored protein